MKYLKYLCLKHFNQKTPNFFPLLFITIYDSFLGNFITPLSHCVLALGYICQTVEIQCYYGGCILHSSYRTVIYKIDFLKHFVFIYFNNKSFVIWYLTIWKTNLLPPSPHTTMHSGMQSPVLPLQPTSLMPLAIAGLQTDSAAAS